MKKVGFLMFPASLHICCVPSSLMEFPCARVELVEYFRAQMDKDPGMASAVAAIRTLLEFLKRDKGVLLSFIHMCCWK